jgi:LPXTG-motif cell wall-anchored protein
MAGLALAPTAASAADAPAPGTCVQGHIVGTGQHCYTEGYSNPKDRPVGAPAVIVEPTAAQCAIFRQQVADGKGTLAALMLAAGLDSTGCPPAGTGVGTCVQGHNTVTNEHCYTEGYSDPKDRPAGYPLPTGTCVEGHDTVTNQHCYTPGYSDPKDAPKPGVGACDTSVIDSDGDYDCTPFPAVATGSNGGTPAVAPTPAAAAPEVTAQVEVKGVTVANPAAAPAKAATLSQPALAAAAAPAATTKAAALPLTGGDITGIILLALAGLGIGGALLLVDKRRRTA